MALVEMSLMPHVPGRSIYFSKIPMRGSRQLAGGPELVVVSLAKYSELLILSGAKQIKGAARRAISPVGGSTSDYPQTSVGVLLGFPLHPFNLSRQPDFVGSDLSHRASSVRVDSLQRGSKSFRRNGKTSFRTWNFFLKSF